MGEESASTSFFAKKRREDFYDAQLFHTSSSYCFWARLLLTKVILLLVGFLLLQLLGTSKGITVMQRPRVAASYFEFQVVFACPRIIFINNIYFPFSAYVLQ